MSDASDASRPLLHQGGAFPQQGQIDWAALSKTTVEFTVETLSRISKAGVEALTLCAANAMFRRVELGTLGEGRVLDALGRVGTFSSANNALWFGFGSKSTVRVLAESSEGLACIGICSCLTEEFSSETSATILRELFLLYRPPSELTPSIQQWRSLVEATSGIFTSSNFGHTLYGLSRLCLADDQPSIQYSSSAESIAAVLKELFDVSIGKTAKVCLNGGADCAWIAAVAHWLLGLSVTIQNESGDVIYRSINQKTKATQDNGVFIHFNPENSQASSALMQRSYNIPSGRLLLDIPTGCLEGPMLAYGRLDWSTCLQDAFGKPMKMLLTSLAPQTGACLGSAARILEHLALDKDFTILPPEAYEAPLFPLTGPGAFGRGFFLLARNTLPELHKESSLLHSMERMLDKPVEAASKEYFESINSIRTQCQCTYCDHDEQDKGKPRVNADRFCAVLLILVVCDLIRLLSQVTFEKDLPICPTLSGIQRMYLPQRWGSEGLPIDSISNLVRAKVAHTTLTALQVLFTGRGSSGSNQYRGDEASAIAEDGLCIFSSCLCEVSALPHRACQIHVVPGKIEWNHTLYNSIPDLKAYPGFEDEVPNSKWPSVDARPITNYDNLSDSCSEGINATLLIDEGPSWSRTIHASWSISCSEGFYRVGPFFMVGALSRAWSGVSCHGRTCTSLNGFRSILVKGEGLLRCDQLGVGEDECIQDPILRVLTKSDAAVWVALAQQYLKEPSTGNGGVLTDPGIKSLLFLQGEQCVRCCVTNAVMYPKGGTKSTIPHPTVTVCILTHV